jgi:uncharacterized damage-inducible protein DinB
MATPPMLRQLRHDVWATEKLIEHCRALTDAQLDLTAPGTYGTIRRTLAHIVGGDTLYLALIGFPVVDAAFDEDRLMSLDEISGVLDKVRAGVERVFAGKEFDPDRVVIDARTDPPEELEAWTMLAQFAHHGSDHRAHVGTILGAHGLKTPGLDVWSYGWKIGAMRVKR